MRGESSKPLLSREGSQGKREVEDTRGNGPGRGERRPLTLRGGQQAVFREVQRNCEVQGRRMEGVPCLLKDVDSEGI